jgi:hypothetical protein
MRVYRQKEGQEDRTKLLVTFLNFANPPKKASFVHGPTGLNMCVDGGHVRNVKGDINLSTANVPVILSLP